MNFTTANPNSFTLDSLREAMSKVPKMETPDFIIQMVVKPEFVSCKLPDKLRSEKWRYPIRSIIADLEFISWIRRHPDFTTRPDNIFGVSITSTTFGYQLIPASKEERITFALEIKERCGVGGASIQITENEAFCPDS